MNDLMLVSDSTENDLMLGFSPSEQIEGEKGGGESEEADLGDELDSEKLEDKLRSSASSDGSSSLMKVRGWNPQRLR